jgi:PiT family inorganic phosphate transporter
VRWVVAREIVTAWIITIPAAGLLSAFFYWLSGLFG